MPRTLLVGAYLIVAAVTLTACATVPVAPTAVGEDYPGTCMPAELSWPTDFLESLPGESAAVGGSIVGLRLEYVDSRWVWRLRSVDSTRDASGDPADDRKAGRESIVDVRTLEPLATRQVELTEAEQQTDGTTAYEAAQLSGEKWPSPLIIEMTRVIEGEVPAWRITTCDTETDDFSVVTHP
jgi:predicted small secreted protein